MRQQAFLLPTAILLAAPLLAQSTLYVAAPGGAIYRTDPAVGTFTLAATAPTAVSALVQVGNRLVVGSPTGQLFTLPLAGPGTLKPFVAVDSDVTDLATHGTDLFVSGTSGKVLRLDARTGAEKAVYQSSFEVQALAADEDVLYAGTPFGVFQQLDLTQPLGFTFAGMCGGPIQSMALTDNELYLGDVTGQVYVFSKITELVAYAYPVENNAESIVRNGGTFLIGGSNGTIHRVMQLLGTKIETLVAPEAVADMALESPIGTLSTDKASLSVASGGTVGMDLSAAVATAGDTYLLLGSAAGTKPGMSSGEVHLALNPDAYFTLTLPPFGDEPLINGFGPFDVWGGAHASLVLPAGLPPVVIGLTLNHAFVTWSSSDPTEFKGSSNSVSLLLTP